MLLERGKHSSNYVRWRGRGLRTPSLVDAIVYATARIVGEDLVTGDKLFKDLPLVAYIGD